MLGMWSADANELDYSATLPEPLNFATTNTLFLRYNVIFIYQISILKLKYIIE